MIINYIQGKVNNLRLNSDGMLLKKNPYKMLEICVVLPIYGGIVIHQYVLKPTLN